MEILQAGNVMQQHDFETNYTRFFNWREILTGLSVFVHRGGTPKIVVTRPEPRASMGRSFDLLRLTSTSLRTSRSVQIAQPPVPLPPRANIKQKL